VAVLAWKALNAGAARGAKIIAWFILNKTATTWRKDASRHHAFRQETVNLGGVTTRR
jgi:hypothetical protein